uniref:Uncharacterized protein n=1 Tax=Nymphaea colorata TaxID=210225 RepID=A0A5K1GW35_9MAGN
MERQLSVSSNVEDDRL